MDVLKGLFGFAMTGGFIYSIYYLTKNVSYWIFYESMVISTIMEVLRSQGLI